MTKTAHLRPVVTARLTMNDCCRKARDEALEAAIQIVGRWKGDLNGQRHLIAAQMRGDCESVDEQTRGAKGPIDRLRLCARCNRYAACSIRELT